MMEAADHVFSSEARNWGWQSFARRSDLYYNNPTSKAFDAFIISCTITYSATAPTPAPVISHKSRLVPAELLDAFAGMFDDPLYSDVRFVIRTRSRRTGRRVERSLYAIRKVLIARSECRCSASACLGGCATRLADSRPSTSVIPAAYANA